MVVLLAVRLAIALKEVSGADLLLAVSAHEVFGVPRPAHGGHHLPIQDIKVFKNMKNKSLHLRFGYSVPQILDCIKAK